MTSDDEAGRNAVTTSPCLDPAKTAYQKMIEAIEFSEAGRRRADQILADCRPEVARDLAQRHRESGRRPPLPYEIDIAAEYRATAMPMYNNAMSDERWGWRLALMYAEAHRASAELSTQSALLSLLNEVRELRADARAIATITLGNAT